MTPTNGVTSVADYFRRAEMSGRWRLKGLPPEDLPMPELLAAVSFEASDPLPRCGSFRDRSLARRQHRGPDWPAQVKWLKRKAVVVTALRRRACEQHSKGAPRQSE